MQGITCYESISKLVLLYKNAVVGNSTVPKSQIYNSQHSEFVQVIISHTQNYDI